MTTKRTRRTTGLVSLVGGGPGDPTLLTVSATTALRAADLVITEAAAPAGLLALVREGAEVLEAGPDDAGLLVTTAREGRRAVRLLPGDAFSGPSAAVATELALAVRKARQPLEVLPGLPADVAVPAYLGVPLGADRTVLTTAATAAVVLAAPGTRLLSRPLGEVPALLAGLVDAGLPVSTPVLVSVDGASTRQRAVTATAGTLAAAQLAQLGAVTGSALVVLGDAVRLRERLAWYDDRPLFGWTVLVPRTREQASDLVESLRALGADPLEVPTIAVEAPRTPAPMERVVRGLVGGRYAWVAFTSANAVRAVREGLEASGLDARALNGVRLAAVGDATAEALAAFGVRADLLPSGQQSSEGLLADFPDHDPDLDLLDRVLLPRADIATETLAAGLKVRGWAIDDVTAYRTVRAAAPPASVREALRTGKVDAAIFTSSSTVRNLVALAGKPHPDTVIAAIGPQTAATAAAVGLRVDLVADVPGPTGLVAALAAFASARKAERAEAAAAAAALPPAAAPAPVAKRVRPSRAGAAARTRAGRQA